MCTGSEREVRINCVHACVHAGSDRLLAVESGERSKACWLLACLLSGEKKIRRGAAPPTERESMKEMCERERCVQGAR